MQGFEIDHKAFRAQNVGRPPEHLIREAVQNAFDEKPLNVSVTIQAADGRGLEVIVQDDGPGFADEREIFTIFASGKRDDPTKRGRLGRGLKELISVSSESEVLTAGKRVRFEWNGKTLVRSARRCETSGTKISALVPTWKKADIDRIVSYLRLFIPPTETTMIVNGMSNLRPTCEHKIRCMLPTITYSDAGVPSENWRTTTMRLLRSVGDRWIYEMGIPVERIPDEDGFEWSIDVGQRTPLRPERDMLPRSFVHALYAYSMNELVDRLPVDALSSLWVEEGVGNHNFEKRTKGKVYVERRFGSNAARAIVNDQHDRNVRAQENGVNVIRTEHVSASVRDIIKECLPSTADLYPIKCAETKYIPEHEWTDGERKFVGFAKWIAAEMKLTVPTFFILESPGASCEADTNGKTFIRVNRSGVGATFFTTPRVSNWLPLIVHELAHRVGEGHDAMFWREVERLSGEAAEILYSRPSKASDFLQA